MDAAVSVISSGLLLMSTVPHWLLPDLHLHDRSDICHLNVPVTELIPHKVVNLGKCDTKFELIHIFCNIFYKAVAF